jgi:rod shape determining protein RodA
MTSGFKLNFNNLGFKLSGLKTITICLLVLSILSLLSIYSGLHQEGRLAGGFILHKQAVWIIISWISLAVFSFINYRLYYHLSYYLYALVLALLMSVSIFGKAAMGAQRWLEIFGFTFQPSEFSKIAIIIILARFFSRVKSRNSFKEFLVPFGLVMVNALVIFKQPDLGTALVIIFLFLMVGLFSKTKKSYFIGIIVLGLIASPFALKSLKSYQKKRLMVFVNPNLDPLGSGYTIIQSKIAIGSGRMLGKGFLSGTQNQFNFLPERHTDFIFTIIAEEWGFLGALVLLLIYWTILKKILQKLENLRDSFAYFLSLGICSLYFLHIFINIGMTLSILPVVGLPLIFLSYGGTNLLVSFILMGMFFNICRQHR